MKQTFGARTFRAFTFKSGTWTGLGVTPAAPSVVGVTVAGRYEPVRVASGRHEGTLTVRGRL